MDNEADNDGFGDEMWSAERNKNGFSDCTDASDMSDFTPTELVLMKRHTTINTAPLPQGVADINWQPPVATGLEHSDAIFKTKLDERGVLLVSGEGLSQSNCHFRSWQEDNGVAGTFASTKVEKYVDGHKMSVSVASALPTLANGLVRANPPARPASADAAILGAAPDIQNMRRCSSAVEDGCEVGRSSGKGETGTDRTPPDEDATAPPMQSADGASQNVSATPRGFADTIPDCCEQPPGECDTLALEGVGVGPSLPTSIASNPMVPSTPRSSRARESRPGRTLVTQGTAGDVGAPTLPTKEGQAEVVRRPSHASASGGPCQQADVVGESGADHASSGIAMTSRHEIRGDATRNAGGQHGEQRQQGATNGLCDDSKEPLSPAPNPEVDAKERRKTWWPDRVSRKVPHPRTPPQGQRRWLSFNLPRRSRRTTGAP